MSILAALVLYQRSPEESETFRSLCDRVRPCAELAGRLSLQIYDNSPQAHAIPACPMPVEYTWNPANPGLAAAYNASLRVAVERGAMWLLLLDQDTVLTAGYLRELGETLATIADPVCALVPKLVHAGGVHSPHELPRLAHHGVALDFSGIAGQELAVFNSGALVRVAALTAIGGFPSEFPLDFLDHAVFRALQRAGGQVQVMHAALTHDLSTMRLGGEDSLARYRKVLTAERAFYAGGEALPAMWCRLRRLKQAAGHALKVSEKRFALLDLQAAFGLLSR